MYPNQSNTCPDLSRHIWAILRVAGNSLRQQKLERRYIIFPLFLAGTAASIASPNLPTTQGYMHLALQLMRAFERESIGTNTESTRKILERMIEKATGMTGFLGQDWMGVMDEMGLQVVHFGL